MRLNILLATIYCVLLFLPACRKKDEDVEAPPAPAPALTVTDIDGNSYPVVTIGSQTWMAENLRTTRYRDGDTILNVTDNDAWGGLTIGAWSHYENNPVNDSIYGKLYNWYAAANPNICPQGWHVPTDDEWGQLINHVGGYGLGGGRMKTTGAIEEGSGLWHAPNTGATNESGFSGVPGGLRTSGGTFAYLGEIGFFWSASESFSNTGWFRALVFDDDVVVRNDYFKRYGFCVRCLRD